MKNPKYRSHNSTDTLQALLDVIGHDKRDDIINDEVEQILKTDRLLESDAKVLIAVGKIDEAEEYLLGRADQLDGNHYSSLLSLAKTMESENRHLVTSLMYRSLLVSILERGYTKAYPHGIRYLKKLDNLAASVADWKGFNHHEAFKETIIQAHGRKRSFWSKYEVKKMNERFYLLKIQLLDIEPAIWRRFVVPAGITLDRLHDVIQIVMGWTDSHLHEFTIGKKRYTEYPESKEDGLVCGRYRLGDLVKQKGRTFRYLYDFGDSWEHELVLEESRYFNPEFRTKLACLEGERACPPEDVGGVPGYFEFCNALKDTNHEEHESYMEWSGDKYDSEQFDSESVSLELMKYLRWSRDRYQNWGGVE